MLPLQDGKSTFCPQIFRFLHIVHRLQRLLLLLCKCLFVIVFARPADPIEEYAAGVCVSKEPDKEEDQGDDYGRAERREQPDDDAIQGSWRLGRRHVVVVW